MISINKKFADDQYYRYKMPSILIKKEGNKTILINLLEIINSLKTKKEYLIKFLSEDLGTNICEKNKCITLNGLFEKTIIQESIYNFIENFIICKSCSNPETELYVKNTILKCRCRACGKKFEIQNNYKVCKYMILQLS